MKRNPFFRLVTFYSLTTILFQSFLPFFYAVPHFVSAQEVSPTAAPTTEPTITPTPEPTVTVSPTETPTIAPTSEPTPTVIPTVEPTVFPTPTEVPSATPTPTFTIAPTPTSIPSNWTFEKVELNKEYVAPQNSGVKLTFTKLPNPSGNIKIEEITLSAEQIKQTGSLSDKAYDITSDMKDGEFTYNLSLPIPESSKGKEVSVKFSEVLSSINSAKNVENSITKTDISVSVKSLDHMTIFVVAGVPSSPSCIGASVVPPVGTTACYSTIQAAIDAASTLDGDTINVSAGTYIENLSVTKDLSLQGVAGTNLQGQITISHDGVAIDGFDITNPNVGYGIILTDINDIQITNNTIHDIATTLSGGSAQAIAVISSSSNVNNITINNNTVSNVGNLNLIYSGSGSAKGIYLGNSTGINTISNVTIDNNTISNVYTSTTAWPAGRGAYGILVNHKTTGLNITNNTIGTLEGLWAHAIGLEGNTPSAILSNNTISNLISHKSPIDAFAIYFESNISKNTVSLNGVVLGDTSAIVVDDDWTGYANNPVVSVNGHDYIFGVNAFATIQGGIEAVASNGTVDVAAGSYTEQINITKPLTLSGAGTEITHINTPEPSVMTIYDLFGSKSLTPRYSVHRGTNIPVVRIASSNVTFEGFEVNLGNKAFWNVKGSFGSNYSRSTGILVDHVETISGLPDTFTNISIKNNKVDGMLADDFGDAIKALGNASVSIEGNTIYAYGESGISALGSEDFPSFLPVYHPTVTITSNIIYGGSGTRANYFLGIGYWVGATGTADSNTIYNSPNNGYALNSWTTMPVSFTHNVITTDGGGVGGNGAQLYQSSDLIFSNNTIENQGLVGEIWLNPNITISNNTITNSIDGFLIDNQTSGSVKINNNSIRGMSIGHHAVIVGGTAGVDSGTLWGTWAGPSTVLVDATNNWWGDMSGPSGEGTGIGNSISTNVDYQPWCLNSDCSSTSSIYSVSGGFNLSSTPQNLSFGPLSIEGLTGTGSVFVAKYNSASDVPDGGHSFGVNGFYYNIEYTGTPNWPVSIKINYSDTVSDSNYLDENHFSSLFYQEGGVWKDYRLDTPASTVSIDKSTNIISASLQHLTPIVPVVDTTAPSMSITSPTTNQYINGRTISISGTATDDYFNYYYCYVSNVSGHEYGTRDASCNTTWHSVSPAGLLGTVSLPNDLPDGNYVVHLIGKDKVGNSTEVTKQFVLDNTSPLRPVGLTRFTSDTVKEYPCGAISQRQTLIPTWTANTELDLDHYEYTSFNSDGTIGLNEQILTTNKFVHTWVPTSDGTFGYAVRAVDKAGNKSEWALSAKTLAGSCQIIYDSTTPTKPVFTSPSNNLFTNINAVTLTWSGGDDTGVTPSGIKGYTVRYTFVPMAGVATVSWNSGLRPIGNPKTHSGSYGHGQGTYTMYVSTTDNAGNISPESDALILSYDATAPSSPNITNPTPESYINTSSILNKWDVVNDFSGIDHYRLEYKHDTLHDWDSNPYRTTTTNQRTQTPGLSMQGGMSFRVQAFDKSGNEGSWSEWRHYFYDATAPTITIHNPNTNPAHSKSLTASVSDGTLTMSETTGSVCNNSLTFGAYSDKTYSSESDNGLKVCYKATDTAGNIVYSFSNTIGGIDWTAPTIAFHANISQDADANVSGAIVTYTNPTATDNFDASVAVICSPASGSSFPLESTTVTCSATDTAGNSATDTTFTVTVNDVLAPVTTAAGTDTNWHNSDVTVTLTCTDANSSCAHTYYTTNGDTPTTSSTEGTSIVLSTNGTYPIKYFSVDAYGNIESVKTAAHSVKIDITKPDSSITSPSSLSSGSTVYLNDWSGAILGTATDNVDGSGLSGVLLSIKRSSDGKYYTAGDGWIDGTEETARVTATGTATWNFTLPSAVEGNYTITSHAVDIAGNTENSYTLTIIFDKTIPEVAISLNPTVGDAQNGWYKTQPEVTLTATDTHFDKIEFQWDSQTGTWTTYSAPFKPANEGAHILYYRAHDLADNYSGVGTKNIKWNKTDLKDGPLNVSVSPNPTSESSSKVKWDAATSETIGIDKYEIQWKLKNGDKNYSASVGNGVREYTVDNLVEGVWEVKVTAFDASGNSKSASVDLTVDRSGPTAPTLSIFGTAPGSVSLSWSKITDAVNYIIWYGTTPGSYQYGAKVGDTQSYTVQGLGGGTYYFIVKAVDASGNQGANSNEVSSGAIAGAAGVAPGTPAQGFAEQVLGANTLTPTPTPAPTGAVLGTQTNGTKPWWWPWILLLLLSPAFWFGYKKWKERG